MTTESTGTSPHRNPPLFLRLLDRAFKPDQATHLTTEQQTAHEKVKAAGTMGRYLEEIGHLRASRMDVLDFGCGWGGETLWLASRVRSVCGVDVDREAVDQANRALAPSGATNCRFEWSADGRLPFPDHSFDAVLSTDVFEHVMDLDLAFSEIARVLRPGGVALSRFGPLFYSPNGYHLYWACKVPWAHLFFGLRAIASMRAMRGGSQAVPKTWQDLGLNGRRFSEYRAAARRAGLQSVRFDALAVKGIKPLTMIPLLRNLFVFGIDFHLVKDASRP